MIERQETVREVCAEMREHSSGDASETYYDRFAWEVLIDRILAAHEREMAAKDAEIARLKAALLTICTAVKTAEGLREIAIDACNGKENDNAKL